MRGARARVLLAMRDASNEALINVGKHAGTGRAEVRLVPGGGVRVDGAR